MAPDLAQFERDYASKATIVELDVDKQDTDPNFEKYGKFKKSGYIPETTILRDGTPVFNQVGQMTTAQLKAATDKASE